MATKRKKIGILFSNYSTWTGGFYYILNLIKGLQYLPADQQAEIVIFYEKDTFELPQEVKELNYPYLTTTPIYVKLNLFKRIINKVLRALGVKRFLFGVYSSRFVDFIYPLFAAEYDSEFSSIKYITQYHWVPDFQEKRLPGFFNADELTHRENRNRKMVDKNVNMVFSSNDVANDFNTFYPDNKNKIRILNFASILPDISGISKSTVFEKYNITNPYFISPNQFWNHKNHKIVIDAVYLLVQKGIDIIVYFTGKEINQHGPAYINDLKKRVMDLQLDKHLIFLGFIDRIDQLVLMKNAIAVVQPSLFEGWSTVVEDCKAIEAKILVSDIPIHREQCKENAFFFNPHDAEDLAATMLNEMLEPTAIAPTNYRNQILDFSKGFMNLKN